jgi:DNA-directed RNA polymerase specialized sigma24 family protein
MADERADHTLDATALVHEAYVRLVGGQQFEGRAHFFAAAAEAMRRVLVDHSRNRARLKRGGGTHRLCVGTKSRPVFPTLAGARHTVCEIHFKMLRQQYPSAIKRPSQRFGVERSSSTH